MGELIDLLLSIPLEKFALFLNIQKDAKKIHPCTKNIIQSLLLSNIDEKLEIFKDPIEQALIKHNNEFENQYKIGFSEDALLDKKIEIFQTIFKKMPLAEITAYQEKATNRMLALLDYYYVTKNSYMQKTLTSLTSALQIAYEKEKAERTLPEKMIRAMLNKLVKESIKSEKDKEIEVKQEIIYPFLAKIIDAVCKDEEKNSERIARANKSIELCCSLLDDSEDDAKIVFMGQLDYWFSMYKDVLEAYLERELAEHKEDALFGYPSQSWSKEKTENFFRSLKSQTSQKGSSAEQFFEKHTLGKNILTNYEIILSARACLYSKGKNAVERIMMFRDFMSEQQKHIINKVGNEDIDRSTHEFIQSTAPLMRDQLGPVLESGKKSNMKVAWSKVNNYFWGADPNLPPPKKVCLFPEIRNMQRKK